MTPAPIVTVHRTADNLDFTDRVRSPDDGGRGFSLHARPHKVEIVGQGWFELDAIAVRALIRFLQDWQERP